MRQAQRGEGGFKVFLLLVSAVVIGKGLIGVLPAYWERKNAIAVIEDAIDESRIASHTKRKMMDNLGSNLSFNGIKNPTVGAFEVVRESRAYLLKADYSVTKSYFGNITLVIDFEPIEIDVTDILASE